MAEGYIPVTFVFENNDLLTITTLNKDVGGGKEEIGIKILGVETGEIKGFKASFNPNFLIQGIEVLEGNTVYMRFSEFLFSNFYFYLGFFKIVWG